MVTLNGKVIMKAEDADGLYGYELWLYEPEFEPVSISTIEHQQLDVFPNPADDFVLIKTGIGRLENAELLLYDINGNIIYQEMMPSIEMNLDVSNYAEGMYMLQIKDAQKCIIRN